MNDIEFGATTSLLKFDCHGIKSSDFDWLQKAYAIAELFALNHMLLKHFYTGYSLVAIENLRGNWVM
jgi:hypothetical protein